MAATWEGGLCVPGWAALPESWDINLWCPPYPTGQTPTWLGGLPTPAEARCHPKALRGSHGSRGWGDPTTPSGRPPAAPLRHVPAA